jgi:branched-chain amino acid transport system ATP-binding protein
MSEYVLTARNLEAWYGESQALYGVNMDVAKGELVTFLGLNGAGKTTTLRALMGLVPKRKGVVEVNGRRIDALQPFEIARMGLAYCPEERAIFSSLSVYENLMLPPIISEGGMSLSEIYALFPNLQERRRSQGTKLSGGEQQMLAIARILRTGATILMLDEPTEGLAPVIIKQIENLLHKLKERGYTIILVEQNFRFALGLADRHYVFENGRVIAEISANDAQSRPEQFEELLGV